ncbi:hypothetical protein [Aquimarina pacifica]|uniref:hypothetical protein n=1 Tax=Aquimarina pacifica TaxID=1296415 RepID=UPI00046FDF3B|nr:hypothetical protein [Aquimarina pacifica]
MQKFPKSFVLIVFLLIFNFVNSQSTSFDSVNNLALYTTASEDIETFELFVKEGFSYDNDEIHLNEDYVHHSDAAAHNHDHNHDVVMLDIISSDEGADFNCSGGFCMNKSHYHKKGLTLKKQFFVYFIRISC